MRFDPANWTADELAELSPALLLPESEAIYQAVIVKVARHHGWHVVHTYRAKVGGGAWRTTTTEPGVPDLLMMRPPVLMFVEVKAQTGKPSADQVAWLRDAAACDVGAYLARPTDWPGLAAILTAVTEPVEPNRATVSATDDPEARQ